MAFTVDESKAKHKTTLTSAEEKKYEEFKSQLAHVSTLAAAAEHARCELKELKGGHNQWEIYLSKGNRVSFLLSGTRLEVRTIGGHT